MQFYFQSDINLVCATSATPVCACLSLPLAVSLSVCLSVSHMFTPLLFLASSELEEKQTVVVLGSSV